MRDIYDLLGSATGFQWDAGNAEKNWLRHGVSRQECEELFEDEALRVAADGPHSTSEPRFAALGRSRSGRWLFVSFTLRGDRIRVISARDMSRRERRAYSDAEREAEADSSL